jgi:uncharacterized protein DUF2569
LDQITAASIANPRRELQGVEGWLLVFCLFLVFVWPISSAVAAITILRSKTMFPVLFESQLLRTVVIFGNFGFGVYSFIAGMKLWSRNPRAPRFVRIFLTVSIGGFVAVELAFFANGVRTYQWQGLLGRFLFLAIWYVYLLKSRRVAAIYLTE